MKELIRYVELSKTDAASAMYIEGPGTNMDNPEYYRIGNSISCHGLYNVDPSWFLLNVGIVRIELLLQMGGWDGGRYETTFGSHLDLAIRIWQAGINMDMIYTQVFKCSHMPNDTGDHAPIFHAHNDDMAKIRERFSKPFWPPIVDINSWKNSPDIWERRFG